MGGKSKSVTVGYKYYVGLHAVYCHGPIDKFTRVYVDRREAWAGTTTGGQITISAPDLFGGESREGGVSGTVDVMMGAPAQSKNAYLLSKIGPNIPAYRGVAGMVFRDFYWGNNPYLKPISVRGTRVHTAASGAEQWFDDYAGVPQGGGFEVKQWKYLAVPLADAVDRSAVDFDDSDWAVGFGGFGNFGGAVTNIAGGQAAWFRRTVPAGLDSITMTFDDEGSVYFNGAHVDDYTIGTHVVNLPSSAGGLVAVRAADTVGGFFQFTPSVPGQDGDDMNGVHMVRECLTDPDWGMGYQAGDIDDTTFQAAALTAFGEGLALSLLWSQQVKVEDFIGEVMRHIDGALYVDRTSGKFTMKLIRADYDPDDLITLDESNIDRLTNPARPESDELVNSVTVEFWNPATGKDDSVTVQDPAGVQMQGRVINTSVKYPGFTSLTLAQRAAARDLRSLSNPFFSCTIFTGDAARGLDIGSVFKLSWAKWNLVEVVMRVTGFAVAEGGSNQVRIECVEDVFATPLNAVMAPPAEEWVDPSQPPEPSEDELAGEVPYYEIVQSQGQTDTDNLLTANPELGYVFAAAARPASAINAKLWTDAGGGYEEVDTLDFCPSGLLQDPIGKTDTAAVLLEGTDLDLVTLGTVCQVGDELMRVDSIDDETGAFTFGRGVLDTVPQNHEAGERVYFWDAYNGVDPTEYADGEVVGVKVTPMSGAGVVDVGDATEHLVTLDQRAYRPYPPGDMRIDGDSYVDTAYDGALSVSWVGRDRTQQTGGDLADHFDANIGPEAGVTTRVRTYVDDVLVDEQDEVAASPAAVLPGADGMVRVEVSSKRDGLYSMQAATHEFPYVVAGSFLVVEDGEEYHVTEAGDYRATED